jgi:hypothetical protein
MLLGFDLMKLKMSFALIILAYATLAYLATTALPAEGNLWAIGGY